MTIGSGKIRPYDQELRTYDFSFPDLVTQFVYKVPRSAQILYGCDTVGQDPFFEDVRYLATQKSVTVLIAAVVQPLDMNMAIDKSRHKRHIAAVNDLCGV